MDAFYSACGFLSSHTVYLLNVLLWVLHSCFLPQNLREIQLHDLTIHLDIFEDHRENDFEEIMHRFADTQAEFQYPL